MSDCGSDPQATTDTPLPNVVGSVAHGFWTLHKNRHLGSGHFGDVYEGEAVNKSKAVENVKLVAIKVSKTRISSKEILALRLMRGVGAPELFFSGTTSTGWHILVMERCGKSLYSVIEQRSKGKNNSWTLSISEARDISMQALALIERLHSVGYVHADIKPANFVCACTASDFSKGIRLVDFGLSRPWKLNNGRHIDYWQHLTHFAGSLRYASLHAHLGRGLTRRDDIESLGYMMLYLMCGSLPWQGFHGENKNKLICLAKGAMSVSDLCRGAPEGMLYFMAHVRSIGYQEKPDYDYLLKCLNFDRVEITNPLSDIVNKKTNKRGERSDDDEPAAKKHRVLPSARKVHQWIIVSTQHEGSAPAQQMLSATDVLSLEKKVLAASKPGRSGSRSIRWRLVSMCYAECMFKAVLTQDALGALVKEQKLFRVQSDAEFLDIVEKLSVKAMSITEVIGASGSWVLAATSFKKERFSNQMFALSETFPTQWVADNWDDGYFITALGAQSSKWAVVMSRGDGVDMDGQSVELSFSYPSESIRARWRDGYTVTSSACTVEQSAYVLSKLNDFDDVVQRCTRTSHDPCLKLAQENDQLFTIDALTFGRVE